MVFSDIIKFKWLLLRNYYPIC